MSMPTCPSCIYAKGICEKTGVKIRYSTGCTYHKSKPMTNYERLVSASPEELAEFLEMIPHCGNPPICTTDGFCIDDGLITKRKWLEWLKEEAKE